jgi:excinuclease UvrABC nuclease subunit
MYQLAREHFPAKYAELVKLRLPPYVKVVLGNEFPRAQVTTQLVRGGVYYGPFRARATAERFEASVLDLFQVRRCQEDLAPSPEHPGCIYGEMSMCLRPCQQIVGPEEYGHEVGRLLNFLESDGATLANSITAARDRFSEEMDFEEAAREHRRLEKVNDALRCRDELARELSHFYGVAVLPSAAPSSVELLAFQEGWCRKSRRVSFEVEEGRPVSLDTKLREAFADLKPEAATLRERQEYLALLARWYYSSWRDGEWLAYDGPGHVPYRKLVQAISRLAKAAA